MLLYWQVFPYEAFVKFCHHILFSIYLADIRYFYWEDQTLTILAVFLGTWEKENSFWIVHNNNASKWKPNFYQ